MANNEVGHIQSTQQRLHSLDALRGFDMLWIICGNVLLISFMTLVGFSNTSIELVSQQLEHVGWQGFHAYDLIFPLFVFMSGISLPFSLFLKQQEGLSLMKLYWKAFKRFILLTILGLSFTFFKLGFTALCQ